MTEQSDVVTQRMVRAALRMGLDSPASAPLGKTGDHSGPARAAAMLVALGPDIAGELLKNFSPHEAQSASSLLASSRTLDRQYLIGVLREFRNATMNMREIPFDPDAFVESLLNKFDKDSPPDGRLETIRADLQGKVPYVELLCSIPSDVLHRFLHVEHPQFAATILAMMPPNVSARVLEHFDAPTRAELVQRLVSLFSIEAGVLGDLNRWVTDTVKKYFGKGVGAEPAGIGGVKPVVDILSAFRGDLDKQTVDALRKRDPSLAAELDSKMFYFENFSEIPVQQIQLLIRQVPRDVLVVALKGSEPSLRDIFLSNMSERQAEVVRFEMENLPPLRVQEIEDKRREVVRIARQLEQENVISLERQRAATDAKVVAT